MPEHHSMPSIEPTDTLPFRGPTLKSKVGSRGVHCSRFTVVRQTHSTESGFGSRGREALGLGLPVDFETQLKNCSSISLNPLDICRMGTSNKRSEFTLFSENLKTQYVLFADVPAEPGPHQLVLVLDADDQFEAAREAASGLQKSENFPPLLLIGIGYGGGYRSPVNKRLRDYSPTATADEPTETGRAAEFLDFVRSTLLPELKNRYLFRPDDIALTGHSLGSLLSLYALTQPSTLFRRYLVSAPSIWWDNRSILKIFEETQPTGHKSARAFFSVGAEDTPSMLGDLDLLQQQLTAKPRPGLEYVFHKFPQKDHYSVLPEAFTEGFRWLYAPPSDR